MANVKKPWGLKTIFGLSLAVLVSVLFLFSVATAVAATIRTSEDTYRETVRGDFGYLELLLQHNEGEPESIKTNLEGYKVGNDSESFVVLVQDDVIVGATDASTVGASFAEVFGSDLDISMLIQSNEAQDFTSAQQIEYYVTAQPIEGLDALLFVSKDYVFSAAPSLIWVVLGSYLTFFVVLLVAITLLLNRKVVREVSATNASLAKITAGNLDERVKVESSAEFAVLSKGINCTVDSLKEAIGKAEAAAWMERELSIASEIQLSAMPKQMSHTLEDNPLFTLYADIKTAKEVGGDFYDYFVIGEHQLGFVMADVSGKGIPAAMFMMTAKTHIKLYMEQDGDLALAFDRINEKLCENNDVEMFVTVFAGVIDLETLHLRYINAGHNPSVLMRGGEERWLNARSGPLVGMIEEAKYRELELQLEVDDLLFLYTDGVTEATDAERNMFGTARLVEVLKESRDKSLRDISADMYDKIIAFENGAPREDDITMLLLKI